MKYFVMSDIHGDYNAMMKAIKESGYDKRDRNHQLIVIGDFFGRANTGKGAYGVYKYLTSRTHKNKPVCIKGNHEEYFVQKIFERGYVTDLDCVNGEDKTVFSFFAGIKDIDTKDYQKLMKPVWDYLDTHPTAEEFEDRFNIKYLEEEVCAINLLGEGKKLCKWLKSLPYYFETKNYIFTHGWLPYRLQSKTNKLSDYNREMFYKYKGMDKFSDELWHRWVWVKTPENYSDHCYYYPNGWDKWIVVGHWHAFDFGPRSEFFNTHNWDLDDLKDDDFNYVVDEQHKVIFCDHCTALGHKINMLIVEDTVEDK